MKARNFVVTVKEGEAGHPCFLQFELHEEIGLPPDDTLVSLMMPEGTGLEDARALARTINDSVQSIQLRR